MEVSPTQIMYAAAAVVALLLIFFFSKLSTVSELLTLGVGAAAGAAAAAVGYHAYEGRWPVVIGGAPADADPDGDYFGGRKRAAPVPDPNWKARSAPAWDKFAEAYTAGYAGAPAGAAEFVANAVLVAAGKRPAHRVPAPAAAAPGRTARPPVDAKLAAALAGTGLTLTLDGDGGGLLQREDAKKPLPAATSGETEAGRKALGFLEPGASGPATRTLLWRVEDLSREHMRPRTFLVECVTGKTSDADIEKRRAEFAAALAPHVVTVKALEPGTARPAARGAGDLDEPADNVFGGYIEEEDGDE